MARSLKVQFDAFSLGWQRLISLLYHRLEN